MKTAILYAYPPQPDGLSMQGDMLYRGMKENGEAVMPCHISSEFQKEWIYQYFEPDVAVGVGFWSNTPDLVIHTQKCGVIPVPWLVADGWVANYHDILGSLPLVLTTSDWVRRTYERDGVDVKNFEVMHIGVEPDVYLPISKSDPRVHTIRHQLGVRDDELMILTVGGDVTSKGAQEVFKALKIVDQQFKNWKYVCKVWGGDSADDHYDAEMRLIEELGDSKDKVVYLEGSLSREFMPLLLNACDIYAAPSRLEGFGMIQVEAQACGIPVISINEMGPRETIIHGKTGFLANVADTIDLTEEWAYPHMGFDEQRKIQFEKPKTFAYRVNVDELADYLLQLLKDADLRKTLGIQARAHAIEKFAYRTIAERIANLLKERLQLT